MAIAAMLRICARLQAIIERGAGYTFTIRFGI